MFSTDEKTWEFQHERELPLVLIRLKDFTVEAATAAAFTELGVSSAEVLDRNVLELLDDDEQIRAGESLRALAEGTVDFYQTYRPLSPQRTERRGVNVWSQGVNFADSRYAVSEVSAAEDRVQRPLTLSLGYAPHRFAIGIMDEAGVVTSVSDDLASIVGVPSDELLGRQLLGERERGLWEELRSTPRDDGASASSASIVVIPESSRTESSRIRCFLVSLANSTSTCFILADELNQGAEDAVNRIADLEQRLWRIAQEVHASGLIRESSALVDVERFPQLRSLNARHWEVLTRLLRGERVPTIAAALFLSQSAIRSNLSAIFQRFGVHSQSELLALLRS
jgi:DNA-binding NarL/FixJ family response regulator